MGPAEPVDVATLPPFSNQRGCPRCGARYEIRVHFDRDCAEVRGDHFHRLCRCGHRWLERLACVPATKTNVAPTPPGTGGTGTPNTFGCYKIKCRKATLPTLQLNDQFGSRPVTPSAPKLLCAPVAPPTTTSTTTTSTTTTTPGPTCANGGVSCNAFCGTCGMTCGPFGDMS